MNIDVEALRREVNDLPSVIEPVNEGHEWPNWVDRDDVLDLIARLVPAEDAEPLPAGHPDTWPGGTMHMPSSAMNSAEDMQAVADEAAARLPQYGDAAKHREVCSLPECHEGCPTCVFAGTDAATNHPPPKDAGRPPWPRPDDFDKMTNEEREAYIARIEFDKRIEAAMSEPVPAEDGGRLTPLQREVETEPSCTRCGQPITRLGDLYRCAQCHAAFDLACIHKHFDWSVNPNPHVRHIEGDTP